MTRVISLRDANRPEAGGKARGLARLLRLGLPVPSGVVLVGAQPGAVDRALLSSHVQPGTRYAVRSSAVHEDGQEHSFAGQFHTALDCEGLDGVLQGIETCLEAAHGERVSAYTDQVATNPGPDDNPLALVIQEMVDARRAGVLFTAEPVSGRRDRWTLSTTEGLGESLVAGETDGVHTVLTSAGEVVSGQPLPQPLHDALMDGARRLQDDMGGPVDVEFAIDGEDRLWWLQARPVTALPRAHFNELDDVVDHSGAAYTTANVSEMLPGPITPLSLDVVARALDRGMQDFFVYVGALPRVSDHAEFIYTAYQHLFLRLDALYAGPRAYLGATKRDLDLSIVGRFVPEVPLGQPFAWPRRVLNLGRLMLYLRQVDARKDALRAMANDFRLEDDGTPEGLHGALGHARDLLCDAYAHHYAASVQSGTWLAVINAAIAGRGQVPTAEQLGLTAALLSGIEEVESADAVRALDGLADTVSEAADTEAFLALEPAAAHAWLHAHDDDAVRRAVAEFERRHGHRGLREAELRTRSWAEDTATWTQLLQTRVRQGGRRTRDDGNAPPDFDGLTASLSAVSRRMLRFALPRARRGVAAREHTKAHVIRFQDHIKRGYRTLAQRLVQREHLPETDLVWFLGHAELRALMDGDASLVALARERRALLPQLWTLSFPELSLGRPRPLESPDDAAPDMPVDGTLRGVPVSRGRVQGRAFIARRLEDAEALRPGDILIARTTDVGWSPWFAIAGGIVTEIGSPLSHGAVVAREYGIPAVVAVKGATSLPHGATLVLDGDTGSVTVVDDDGLGPSATPGEPADA